MSQAQVRLATADDLRAFAGCDPPDWCIEWVSYVLERDGKLVALGTIAWDAWGRTWGMFDCRDKVSPFLMHRMARNTIGSLREIGVERLHAYCDERVPRSDVWLRRLGFRPGAPVPLASEEVWVCDLSK